MKNNSEIPEPLKSLIRSQQYQLEKLSKINDEIAKLELELKGGSFKEKEKGF